MSYPALPCQQRPRRTDQGPMHAVCSTRRDRSGGLSAHVSRKAAGATAAQLVCPTLRRDLAPNQDGHEQGNMPVQLAHVHSPALRTRSRCRMLTITTHTDHGGAAIAACSCSCQCLCVPRPQESRASGAARCPWRRERSACIATSGCPPPHEQRLRHD